MLIKIKCQWNHLNVIEMLPANYDKLHHEGADV